MFRAPGRRSAAPAPWNVLVEAVAPMATPSPEKLLYEGLRSALETGLVADAAIAANEAQAEGFWRLRDSISEAEKKDGPAAKHDISVPVEDDGRASPPRPRPRSRRASRARGSTPSAISATATSISTSAPPTAPARTGSIDAARR